MSEKRRLTPEWLRKVAAEEANQELMPVTAGRPPVASKDGPASTTRAALIDRITRRHSLTRKTSGEVVDAVLDAVERDVREVLGKDWAGGEMLARLRRLRGSEQKQSTGGTP